MTGHPKGGLPRRATRLNPEDTALRENDKAAEPDREGAFHGGRGGGEGAGGAAAAVLTGGTAPVCQGERQRLEQVLVTDVHSSTVHDGQRADTASAGRWRGRGGGGRQVHTPEGRCSPRNGREADTCRDADGP